MSRLVNEVIEQSRYDIQSIENYITSQNDGSISNETVRCLRGFQSMFRQRIVIYELAFAEAQPEALDDVTKHTF